METYIDRPLHQRHILLCVAGGIAAYKSVELLRLLVGAGATVQVAMTRSAQEFVGPLTFQTLSGRRVFTDIFDSQQDADIGHIRAADGADLLIVAPATANLIARITAGMANDPVAASVLACRAPVLVAPSMNVNMWEHPATVANVATLRGRGLHFVGPDSGFLACQWTGSGRLSDPAEIVEAASRVLSPQDCAGLRFVVSAGGTREALDPVRFIGNRSTGEMGFALARAARRRGAEVTLITGPTHLDQAGGAEVIAVQSAHEMHQSVVSASATASVVIMAAAVADYRPKEVSAEKLKKESWGANPSIELERTQDILAELGASRSGDKPYLVGFAAETEDLLASAQAKLKAKKCDLIVANDVSKSDRGFGAPTNEVLLVGKEGETLVPLASKDLVAHRIITRVLLDLQSSSGA